MTGICKFTGIVEWHRYPEWSRVDPLWPPGSRCHCLPTGSCRPPARLHSSRLHPPAACVLPASLRQPRRLLSIYLLVQASA